MSENNDEMIAYWNGPAGETWAQHADDQDRLLQPLGDATLAALAPSAGDAVLDVGCGPGTTTLALAAKVGPTGRAVGVDVSAPLLSLARDRAAGTANVEFVEADAQTMAAPPEPYDAIFSRFGVMFFDQPVAAFANLRAATRRGGRLAFVCWTSPFENPWLLVPTMAVAGVAGLDMPPPPGPEEPGPFAFADPDRVRTILESAGWGDVGTGSYADEVVDDDLDRRTDLSLRVGPAARALAGAPESVRVAAAVSVRAALADHVGDDGLLRLQRSAWVVTATG